VRYREQQPTFIPPMLLSPGALPGGDQWSLEVKWDGCRAQLRYDGRTLSLRSRTGRECSGDFAELAPIAEAFGRRRVTLDGELVCRVGEMGLEGAVAKRLDSRYSPGRRSRAWIKHKVRRQESLLVTGVRRTSEGKPRTVFVARPRPDGSLAGAGSIELGLGRDLIEQLEDCLRALPAHRRGSITWYPAEVSVIASVHGLPGSAVRDAILRDVVDA
jgi:ATP-dependent DNA ligase